MMAQHDLIQMITQVANALEDDLRAEMAFVGGVTTGLLLTDDFAREQVRSTDDVDLIVHVIGNPGFNALQARLQKKGFQIPMPAPGDTTPICAMKLGELRVDFMPDDEEVLGFTNRWYSDALANATPYTLPAGPTIRLVTGPYFVATKLEAWKGRGQGDALSSRDIEDLLALVDGREDLIAEVKAAPANLWDYIASELKTLLGNDNFLLAMESQAQGNAARTERLHIRLEQLAK